MFTKKQNIYLLPTKLTSMKNLLLLIFSLFFSFSLYGLGSISGASSICVSDTTTYTNLTTGGTWSCSGGHVTIGSISGLTTGISAGTATISYTDGSSIVTKIIIINPIPATISGSQYGCTGSTTTLSNATGGGIWTSSNSTVADIGSATGVLSSLIAGTTIITYKLTSGCFTTLNMVVNTQPDTIIGPYYICPTPPTIYRNHVAGGFWIGALGAVAIDSFTGLATIIPGFGLPIITYTTGPNCYVTKEVIQGFPPDPINAPNVCGTMSWTASDPSPGGFWTSGNTGILAVDSFSGVYTGVSAGTTNLTYTLPNGCSTHKRVPVNPIPLPIIGPSVMCFGDSVLMKDSIPGGQWFSQRHWHAGTSNGFNGTYVASTMGYDTISYLFPPFCMAQQSIFTISSVPPITGNSGICKGLTDTLKNTIAGGHWVSSNTSIAQIGSTSGVINGVTIGTVIITYTMYDSATCFSTKLITIKQSPGPLSGTFRGCPGLSYSLFDSVTGGRWSTDSPTIASLDSISGLLTTYSSGISTITYTLSNGCSVAKSLTVEPLPYAGTITGATHTCIEHADTLRNTATGGIWSIYDASYATIGSSSGIVTGIVPYIDTFYYTITNFCGTATAKFTDTILNPPFLLTITGPSVICIGYINTFNDGIGGGIWSNHHTDIELINPATGAVTGIAPGIDTIYYTATNVCGTDVVKFIDTVIIIPIIAPITGPDTVCIGDSVVYADSTLGGLWNVTSSKAIVTPDGIVTGLLPGNDTLNYTSITECGPITSRHPIIIVSMDDCHTLSHKTVHDIKISPNPNNGKFGVIIESDISEKVNIALKDVIGSNHSTKEGLSNTTIDFDMGFEKGVFIISAFTSKTGYHMRAKVIVR